ncbi:hypothetical protein [Rodentibacter genomosp. 2]|uniref:Uncharacterized protein n=1 Tax=Rodentibacter genomosp. 2 TaxID=1908266 RepID=A0A1V3JLI1_9PAST|nr:hypothetical protein [Rodentibacter genomosp. 2]OOF57518.1 hypothetical protein BKK55_04465 [Rodentibacter genomosp. 2]
MNKNFKVLKRNEQLERRALKVFVASYAALSVSSVLAISSASTIGQDNIVIGNKGVSDGYQNIVTAEQGTAQGVKSIATGGNLSRDDFYLKLKQFQGLIEEKENKQSMLDEIKANIGINQQYQDILGKQIDRLEKTIDRAGEKNRQITELTEQERDKHNELTQLQTQLEQAKQQIESHSPNGTGDKTVWTDFTVQLGRLDWQKLADASNGTSGTNKLANDLKQMVETDYPDFTDKWNLSHYEEIIHGYINRQGLFDSNQDRLGISYNEKSDYIGFSYDYIGGTPLVGNIMSYEHNNNRYNSAGGNSLVNHLEKLREVKSTDISITPLFTMSPKQYENMVMGDDATSMFAFYNLKQLINSQEENSIKNIAQSYTPIFYRYTEFYGKANGANKNVHSKSLLELPPVSDTASIEFIAQKNLHYFLDNTFKNELGAVHNGIVSDDNVKAFISNTDVQYLRNWLTLFYSKFYQKIDFSADDSAWLFDKDHYLAQLSKVEQFSAKLQDYVTAYDSAVANPEDIEAQIRLVTLYNQIRTEKNDLENYYEHIQVNLKQFI